MDLQKIPTDELAAELCRRGAKMISTKTRELYKPGYRLEAVEYIHKQIKADRVLVLPLWEMAPPESAALEQT